MPIWLQIILVIACIVLALNNFGLSQDLKRTEEFLRMARNANERLTRKLENAKKQIAELRGENNESKPKKGDALDFLSADDPMDALLKQVGRLEK